MIITIETCGKLELEQLLKLLKSANVNIIRIQDSTKNAESYITTGDKSIDPSDLFGIWKDNPRSIDEIRKTSWKRD
jgi:hypothetical protein